MKEFNPSTSGQTIDNTIIEITTEGSDYDEIINTIIAPNFHQKNELISELAISFLGNKESVYKAICGSYFNYYFIRAVKNQVHSSTSSFHKNVRAPMPGTINGEAYDVIDCEDDLEYKMLNEEQNELLNKTLKDIKVSWFDKEVFNMYYTENLTYREIEEKHGIDHCLAWVVVDKVKKQIKKQIQPSYIYKKR